MKLSKNIRAYRKANKLSQEGFADNFSYKYSEVFNNNCKDAFSAKAVSKWENGKGMPTMNCIIVLAKMLNTSIDALIYEDIIPCDYTQNNENYISKLDKIGASECETVSQILSRSNYFKSNKNLAIYFEIKYLDGNIYVVDKAFTELEVHENYKSRRIDILKEFSTKRFLQSLLYDGESELYKINKERYASSDWFHENRLAKLSKTLLNYNTWKFEDMYDANSDGEKYDISYKLYDIDYSFEEWYADNRDNIVSGKPIFYSYIPSKEENNIYYYSTYDWENLVDSHWAMENDLDTNLQFNDEINLKAVAHINSILKNSFDEELIKLHNISYCTVGTLNGITDNVSNWDCYVRYEIEINLSKEELAYLMEGENKVKI